MEGNTTNLWSTVNSITNRNSTPNSIPEIRLGNGEIVKDNCQIAENVAKYLTNIGEKLANEILKGGPNKFPKTATANSFYLQEVVETI